METETVVVRAESHVQSMALYDVTSDGAIHRFAYRPALDGLRAVAVMAVLMYHLGYAWLPGGFVGVDLFFVLSGYLITSLLLHEWNGTGRIALGAFWLRRARRLLPALLLMLVAVVIWVAIAAPPFERPLRRDDILWTLSYGANWHFIATSQDYFAQFSSASPLRHTWSLAIEEQFYLVWPVIVAIACARCRHPRRVVAAISAAGIVLSAIAAAWLFSPNDPSRAYYGTDSRLYQLLIGALLAASAAKLTRLPSRTAAWLGAVAAVAIVAALLVLDPRRPAYYFGVALALAACTAVVIAVLEVRPSGLMARALSWSPLRWIGQISYDVYVWHWPIILAIGTAPGVLGRLPERMAVNLTRTLVIFGIATVSFYAIEQPVRRGRLPGIRASAPRFVVVAVLAVTGVACAAVVATRHAPAPPAVLATIPGCPPTGDTPCLRYQDHRRDAPVVALAGDSIARSLDPAFMDLARENGWTYVLAAANGCRLSRLLTSYEGQVRPMDRTCYDETPRRLDYLIADWHPALIVAIDRWEVTDAVGPDGRVAASGTPANLSLTEASLTDVARQLTSAGAHLVFIELPPVMPPVCGAPARRASTDCRRPVAGDKEQMPYNAMFRGIATQVAGVSAISITDALCPGGTCTWDLHGLVPRFDGLHFTPEASRWLAPMLWQRLAAAGVVPGSEHLAPCDLCETAAIARAPVRGER